MLVLAALLAATYRSKLAPPARGAFAALAGLTKFAPLALAPLLATHGLWGGDSQASRARTRAMALASFLAAFVAVGAVASIPALSHDSLHTIYERTFAYQANRDSPFSVWGLYGGLGGLQEGGAGRRRSRWRSGSRWSAAAPTWSGWRPRAAR